MHVTATSQHVKKARKSALQAKTEKCRYWYDDEDGRRIMDDDDRWARRGGAAIATEEGVGWGAGRKKGRRLWDHHARRDLHSIWCLVDIPCKEPE